ncbi:hypothetical protein [Oleidesulfovibrio alaskensis]|nr:hypothetical protein [Oleidesulfovibrio alaskensis]
MQMIPQNRYRLNEYQISKMADGRLWWNSHTGFAIQIGGPCYIYGNVLLMGDRRGEENGFMKSEFLDYLKNFPLWNGTRYYCFSSAIMDTATGGHLSEERLQRLTRLPTAPDFDAIVDGKAETFKLGKYQISISIEGDIKWKSYSGISQIIEGSVLIESDILFIGPKLCDAPEKSKREFIHTLQSLPKWNRTTFWCRSLALQPVSTDKKRSAHVVVKSAKILQPAEREFRNHQRKFVQEMWPHVTDVSAKWASRIRTKWIEKKKAFRNKID